MSARVPATRSLPARGTARRVAIGLATLLAAALVGAQAIAQIASERQPQLAASLWPLSGLTQARLGEVSVDPETLVPNAAAGARARRALASEPLAVNAVRTVGLRQDADGRDAQAARTMALAADLSRRDVPTQTWMIGQAAARGDLDRVLDHYDLALRGSLAAKRLLTPALVKAMAVPGAVEPFSRLVDRHPPWFGGFVAAVAQTGGAAAGENLAAVLLSRPEQMAAVDRRTLASLIGTLAAEGRFAAAERVYGGLPDRAATDGLRWPDFRVSDPVRPFDWTVSRDPAVSAGAVQSGLAVLVTQPGEHRVVEQLLSLSPGRWALKGGVRATSGQLGEARWRLTCARGDAPLGSADARTAEPGVLSVPAGCPYQWLRLTVRRQGDEALDLVARPLSLVPAG